MFKRNRREACRRAGVEPRIEELNGIDPVAYIISANIARRNLTKGQRAMWVAKAYPEARQGKKTSLKINEAVSGGYVRQARTVLRHAPTLADAVLAGAMALNDAYQKAQRIEQEAESEPARLSGQRPIDRSRVAARALRPRGNQRS